MDAIIETTLPNRLYRGKVRDTYSFDGDHLLMVATDRISAFDVVLPTAIPGKGIILTKMSKFWFDYTAAIVPNHLSGLDKSFDLDVIPGLSTEIKQRAMVVRRADRIDVECIARGYITGSAWSEYQKFGTVNGENVHSGLTEGDRFPHTLFTPTTKANEGHDEPLTKQEFGDLLGPDLAADLEQKTLTLYETAHDYALGRGIIIADTKIEYGFFNGQVIVIDELLTPDSSRFWDAGSYQSERPIPNFDKQFVRDWLLASGWDKAPPAPMLPEEVVQKTQNRYLEAFDRLIS